MCLFACRILIVNKEHDLERSNIIAESELLANDEVSMSLDLPNDGSTVWVMPVTFDANQERPFELTCYSPFQVQFG